MLEFKRIIKIGHCGSLWHSSGLADFVVYFIVVADRKFHEDYGCSLDSVNGTGRIHGGFKKRARGAPVSYTASGYTAQRDQLEENRSQEVETTFLSISKYPVRLGR